MFTAEPRPQVCRYCERISSILSNISSALQICRPKPYDFIMYWGPVDFYAYACKCHSAIDSVSSAILGHHHSMRPCLQTYLPNIGFIGIFKTAFYFLSKWNAISVFYACLVYASPLLFCDAFDLYLLY